MVNGELEKTVSEEPIRSYRDLRVWQEAMTLAELCYRLTRPFPREELFGLTSQIRRSATSVAANIAEGHGREHTGSFIQFLRMSQGSLKELETHLLLSTRVGLMGQHEADAANEHCEILGRRLRTLIRALQEKSSKG